MNLNKHFTILLASCIALLGMGVSCKDKNKKSFCEENPGQCQSVITAQEYFLFKIGSWWVYEEEMTHERDSMYVYESVNDSNSYYFSSRIHSELQDYNYHYWPIYVSSNSCSMSSPVQSKCLLIKRSKAKPGEFIDEGYCFYVNFGINTSLGSFNTYYPNNYISVEAIMENYSLGNFQFGKTIKIHELNTFMEGKQPTNHYYSKGIGLIRKELLDSNEVWNLVNYHIEP